jgi:hypothetical protein
MYNITKLSPDSFRFVNSFTGAGSTATELTSYAIARAIVFKMTVPGTRSENVDKTYLNEAVPFIREKLNVIADIIPVDSSRIQELARKFWMMRYNVCYSNEFVFASGSTPSISFMCGFGDVFSDVELGFIQENMQLLAIYTNNVVKLVNELTTVLAN